jgi:hypothetical protein
VLGVLSKFAIAVALVCGPMLAGWCSAQSSGYQRAVRQQAFWQDASEETIPPGYGDGPGDGGMISENDDGEFVGEFGEMLDENSCVCPNNCDDGPESIFPDGVFNNRGPLWYSSVAFTMMQRSAPTHQGTALPLAQLFQEALTTSGQVVLLHPLVMGTSGLDFHFTPGARFTIGRNLFEDILHRQHAIEFTFIGLNTWSTSGSAVGGPGFSTPTFAQFAGLFSPFPLTVGGFNGASLMTMADSSSFSNFEINYRVSKLPRPDRISQLPDGTWMQVATPTLVPSLLAGFRMFTLNDHFNWFSSGVHNDGSVFQGIYNVKTTNVLAGMQIGGDIIMNQNIWQLGVRAKAGVYANLAKQSSEVSIIDPDLGNASGTGQGSSPTTAFIGDLGFFGTTRLTERIYFRGGYDFMWVGGIANAAEQVQYTSNIAPVVRKNGHVLLQGVTLGVDICF